MQRYRTTIDSERATMIGRSRGRATPSRPHLAARTGHPHPVLTLSSGRPRFSIWSTMTCRACLNRVGYRRPRSRAPMASLSRVGRTAFMVTIARAWAPAA
ncbi:hypothetical protein [Ornithinimicrobium kibberense]|uniref:hypothetical protein n=1 Tax=Ornithinimicrobium kibberense TaxID=282060 RepID=UPI0036136F4F